MTNKGLAKLAFNTLDRITDHYPEFGPKIFQEVFLSIFGSSKAYSYYLKIFRRKLLKSKSFDSILIIVDLNIGDAVLLQKSIETVREYFPDSRIDYLCNKLGGDLISENPTADNIYKIFKGGLPSESEINTLKQLVTENRYGLVLNLSPFLKKNAFPVITNAIQLYIPFSAYILYLCRMNAQMHISDIVTSFLDDFLKPFIQIRKQNNIESLYNVSDNPNKGNSVYLSHDAIQTAQKFLDTHNIYSMDRLLLFNPDVTVKYSMIPFELQIKLLTKLLESDDIDYVLITAAYFKQGLEIKIFNALSLRLKNKVIIVNHMPLDAYVSLIDLCDVFLSGDTGTLHIAASWKKAIERNDNLRNRTAVVSVIGPTDSRMFCYDSNLPGHTPAKQDAPSKVFVSASPCRNVTCLNKTMKTCKEIRCFNNIDADKITGYIISYFRYLRSSVKRQG